MLVLTLGVFLLQASIAAVRGGYCDESGWSYVFRDEFEGVDLNTSTWNVLNNTAREDSSCREAMCLSKNVAVQNGNLVLTALKEQSGWANYTTGAVNSQDKAFWRATEQQPFRLCVSGKLPGGGGSSATGLWPAFWMMPNDNSCWPDHGEMDILEEIDGDGYAHATYHASTMMPKTCTGVNKAATSELFVPTLHTDYHEFAVERTPSSILFVYDSLVVFNSSQVTPPLPIWDVPWYLILNFAIGGPWPKPVNSSTIFPAETLVDYVRVSVRQ